MVERKLAVAEHEMADEGMMQSGDSKEGFDGGKGSGGNNEEAEGISAWHGRRRRAS